MKKVFNEWFKTIDELHIAGTMVVFLLCFLTQTGMLKSTDSNTPVKPSEYWLPAIASAVLLIGLMVCIGRSEDKGWRVCKVVVTALSVTSCGWLLYAYQSSAYLLPYTGICAGLFLFGRLLMIIGVRLWKWLLKGFLGWLFKSLNLDIM